MTSFMNSPLFDGKAVTLSIVQVSWPCVFRICTVLKAEAHSRTWENREPGADWQQLHCATAAVRTGLGILGCATVPLCQTRCGPALCYAHSQPTLPPPYSIHLTALLKYIKYAVQRRILIAQALRPHTTPPPPTLDFVQAAFNCNSWTAAAANIAYVASASCTLTIAMSIWLVAISHLVFSHLFLIFTFMSTVEQFQGC